MNTRVDRFLRVFAIAASVVAAAALVAVVFNLWLGARRIGESAIFFAVFSWLALGVRRMMRPLAEGREQTTADPDSASDDQHHG